MVIAELIDHLQKGLQCLRVTIRKVGVLEDVAEEKWETRILGHLRDAFRVKAQSFVATKPRTHQLRPAVASKVTIEELALSAEFFCLGVHVVHELVDERDRDLLDLRLRIRDFAYENIASGIDAAFGVGVEHDLGGELVQRYVV